jgi:hypothetical protein
MQAVFDGKLVIALLQPKRPQNCTLIAKAKEGLEPAEADACLPP